MTESTTRSLLISGPKHQLTMSLPLYGRDIPQALQDLSRLLPDAPTTEDNGQPEEPLAPPDRIPSTTPGAEPPRDARDSGSARSHSTHLETSSSNRP